MVVAAEAGRALEGVEVMVEGEGMSVLGEGMSVLAWARRNKKRAPRLVPWHVFPSRDLHTHHTPGNHGLES